jgi:gamma-glutamyltranspeptidase/glutathione hydrolase
MLNTPRARRGIVTAPHHLAAQAGLAVLREGGNAIEALVATSAAAGVLYPHMTGLGGDSFWLISIPGRAPVAIEAIGRAGAGVTPELYAKAGLERVPSRGPLAAITVAGTVSGWQAALELSRELGGRMSVARLLEDATYYAREGYATTATQAYYSRERERELKDVPGFAERFIPGGEPPAEASWFKNPALAQSLARMAAAGLDDFYRGELARAIAADLARAGSPLTLADLEAHRAERVTPLSLQVKGATLYNLPPPSQGAASLMILGLFDRLGVRKAEGFDHIHGLVEATKHGFHLRDTAITDPAFMTLDAQAALGGEAIARLARAIDRKKAGPWTLNPAPGDTVWTGAIDGDGVAVSFIHSIYWEFGSGVTLRDTGIVWQNRGAAFSLKPGALHHLEPRRKPFHTNNPALARFDDGRVMVYGAMGGDGQPQTQAAVFTRYAQFGQALQQAVTAPRWVLGRTWGAAHLGLRLESRFDSATFEALRAAGHDVDIVGPFNSLMGHAGAVVRHESGLIEGAADPRSDGAVAAF